MKHILFLVTIFVVFQTKAQNCEAYKYLGDTLKYKACKAAEKRSGHYQFSRLYQEALDDALAIDSSFAEAYRAKSTAYLKSGDFITWKALMDKAVQYDPKSHLDYRGWCRFQFFRDYRGAIRDIELLDSLVDYNIGFSANGDYHLHIARALCYKAIGKADKAIMIIEERLKDPEHFTGIYDYLHLGVLYLEKGDYHTAIEHLLRQQDENDLAENRYYIALAHRQLGNIQQFIDNMQMAKKKYVGQLKMFDPYVQQMDKIFLEDIDQALSQQINE
ncbi:MAG: hypothetical protein JXQ90_17250 [Cyclobacteriaceae bacterium]